MQKGAAHEEVVKKGCDHESWHGALSKNIPARCPVTPTRLATALMNLAR